MQYAKIALIALHFPFILNFPFAYCNINKRGDLYAKNRALEVLIKLNFRVYGTKIK